MALEALARHFSYRLGCETKKCVAPHLCCVITHFRQVYSVQVRDFVVKVRVFGRKV